MKFFKYLLLLTTISFSLNTMEPDPTEQRQLMPFGMHEKDSATDRTEINKAIKYFHRDLLLESYAEKRTLEEKLQQLKADFSEELQQLKTHSSLEKEQLKKIHEEKLNQFWETHWKRIADDAREAAALFKQQETEFRKRLANQEQYFIAAKEELNAEHRLQVRDIEKNYEQEQEELQQYKHLLRKIKTQRASNNSNMHLLKKLVGIAAIAKGGISLSFLAFLEYEESKGHLTRELYLAARAFHNDLCWIAIPEIMTGENVLKKNILNYINAHPVLQQSIIWGVPSALIIGGYLALKRTNQEKKLEKEIEALPLPGYEASAINERNKEEELESNELEAKKSFSPSDNIAGFTRLLLSGQTPIQISTDNVLLKHGIRQPSIRKIAKMSQAVILSPVTLLYDCVFCPFIMGMKIEDYIKGSKKDSSIESI